MDWSNITNIIPKIDSIFDQKTADAIIKHRKELGGTLFFDRILSSLNLTSPSTPSKLYPPKSAPELKSLWQKIAKAEDVANERKQAVLFYILRDCRQQQSKNNSSSNIHARFAQAVYLPKKYQVLVSGLWELDHLQFSLALSHLTDPIVGSEFASEIMTMLLNHPKCDSALSLAYYEAKSPPLNDSNVMEGVFRLLSEASVVEAYDFCTQQSTNVHRLLFTDLIETVLAEEDGESRAAKAKLLVSLPLTEQEDQWMEDFLLQDDGAKLHGAKDVVIMRRLACGRSIEGVAGLDNYRGQRVNGINWDDIRSGMESAIS